MKLIIFANYVMQPNEFIAKNRIRHVIVGHKDQFKNFTILNTAEYMENKFTGFKRKNQENETTEDKDSKILSLTLANALITKEKNDLLKEVSKLRKQMKLN
jgi:hypothetical protein